MRIAYLITAYNNFHHLTNLIKKLNDNNSYIYVHVDKKTTIPAFFFSFIKSTNRVVVIQNVKVWWGGWSHQQAILDLISLAREQQPDYFIIMSGQDYPIREKSFLLNLLGRNKEYINIMEGFHDTKPEDRVKYYYFDFFDRRSTSLKTLIFKVMERAIRPFFYKKNYPFKRIYHGSTWCALTSECVDYIMNYMDKNPDFVRFFKTSWCAEESLLPTIIGNSPFVDRVESGICYTDWEGENPPIAMTEKHIGLFNDKFEFYSHTYKVNYTPYFARKFNDNNQNIREQLDKTS